MNLTIGSLHNSYVYTAISRVCCTLPFPEFSYLSFPLLNKSHGSEFAQWDSSPETFAKDLLSGKAVPVTVEKYLRTKSEQQLSNFMDAVTRCIMEDETLAFDHLLRGACLVNTEGKVQEYAQTMFSLKAGYSNKRTSPVLDKSIEYRTKVFHHFFPNLMDTFFKAFNILEAGKKPQTIWDYSAMISIYMSALSFPPALFSLALHLTSAPLYAVVLTAGVTALLAAGLYAYLRWLRPMPHTFPNCDNIKDVNKLFFAHREQKVAEAKEAIKNGLNVMIIGETGRGKTALAHEVGSHLQDKTMQVVKDSVFGDPYCPAHIQLEPVFFEAKKYPHKAVFLMDQFEKPVSQQDFVSFLLKEMSSKRFQIVAICEKGKYEEKVMPILELVGRFTKKIFLDVPCETEMTRMLLAFYETEASNLDCKEPPEAIVRHLIEQTNLKKSELCLREQPNVAIEVWSYVLMRMQNSDYSKYKSARSEEIEERLADLQARFRSVMGKNKKEIIDQLQQARAELEEVQASDQKMLQMIQKIKRLSTYKVKIRNQIEVDIQGFNGNNLTSMKRWVFLSNLEETLENELQRCEKHLPENLWVRLDTKLIDHVIRELIARSGKES